MGDVTRQETSSMEKWHASPVRGVRTEGDVN